MKPIRYIILCILLLGVVAVQAQTAQEQKTFWKQVRKEIPEFKKVFKKYKKYRFEIVYTRVVNDPAKGRTFQRYYFGDHETYFYPASTVKFPMALKTFQKVNQLVHNKVLSDSEFYIKAAEGTFCGANTYVSYTTYMRIQGELTLQQAAAMSKMTLEEFCKLNRLDPASATTIPTHRAIRGGAWPLTVNQMMNDMLIYSNNTWYNLLFELAANEHPAVEKPGIDIHKRLMVCNSPDSARTQKIELLDDETDSIVELRSETIVYKPQHLFANGYTVGKKYYDFNNKLIRKGRNFSNHNQVKLDALQDQLIELIYPGYLPDGAAYEITEEQRWKLIKWMGMRPSEDKTVSDSNYLKVPDDFTNFLYTGQKHEALPNNIRIVNVIGQAYGFVTDCAYMADEDKKVEFFLAARIYVNKDGILNDDKYEYEEIAYPLMEKLGKLIYRLEQERPQGSGALPAVFQIFR